MEELKKKRGRPRKVQSLTQEANDIVNEIREKEKEDFQLIVYEERKKRNGGWDFLKGDPIEYFDATKSYELTGYRPINKTEGLDFNPDWFTKSRDTFLKTGHYCSYPRSTKAYADFWTEEYKRCREGMTVNGYTITGDHYFFLNYYQLMDLTSAKKAGSGRQYAFSSFLVGQYEWFHYMEMAKYLRMNACLMKSRMVGYSEIDAAVIVNSYNCIRNSINLIVAHLSDHLEKTLEKIWRAMSFINDHTDGGFFKLRQVVDKADKKRASYYKIINGQKVETGWMSQIQAIVADKPNKIRGDRTDLLIYEEAGSWPQLTKAFTQADALVGPPGDQFGFRILGGTGGDSGPALEGLKKMYYKPLMFGILPFKHRYTQTGDEATTAFFIPSFNIIANKLELADSRGWFDPEISKKYYDEKRALKASDPMELVTFCAEFCYNAEEAFALEGVNKFDKTILAEQLTRLRVLKEGIPKIENGRLEYTYKGGNKKEENITGLRWVPDENGPIHILEHPMWDLPPITDDEGKILLDTILETANLYVAGIDSIDIGMDETSDYTRDPSKFCISIKRRAYGMRDGQYVAYYKERPNNIREAYEIAIKLAKYYNAPINIEATRMGMITWARDHKYIGMFMRRPRATYPDPTLIKRTQIGSPATLGVIDHGLQLIADHVMDAGHTIWFEEMLEELMQYTLENKTKFDIVASMQMCELADEELNGVTPTVIDGIKPDEFSDIGYYIDENGYKRYGLIPKTLHPKIQVNPYHNPRYEDLSYVRSSDPRRRQ